MRQTRLLHLQSSIEDPHWVEKSKLLRYADIDSHR
jgi:hypothetical protein